MSDLPPDAILSRYGPAAAGRTWARATGGFSGAAVWRGEAGGATALALKAWPPGGITAARLASVHALMRRAGHLPFVPAVVPVSDGSTTVLAAGRPWDLVRWMPGTADFHANPTPARLANACAALARLHRAWQPSEPRSATCPAVHRRLRALADWAAQRPALPPPATGHPGLDDALRRGTAAVARLAPSAGRALACWANRPMPVRPCLCDVWHDHVLFTGNAVTGLIDFGAAREDHVAADLARLLGDLVEDDEAAFASGLGAYHAAEPGAAVDAGFVRMLDRTGVLGGVIGWALRFGRGLNPGAPLDAVAARLGRLVRRLEPLPAV